ncbi:MAG: biotin carboxyl carrier domain-containing protein [Thermoleophilia bacterium]|nr:biotin carboxyl carrier domain-containing protein [Thermoleophilia bacterium]
MPGIFYRRPDPNSEPFAEEGGAITAGDVIGMIEIMKSFHEIRADVPGTVGRFLVENEAAVETDQPLVEIIE